MPSYQNAVWDKSPDHSKKLSSIRDLLTKKSPNADETPKKKSRRRLSTDNLQRRSQSHANFSSRQTHAGFSSRRFSNHNFGLIGKSSQHKSKNDLAYAVMADLLDFED